MTRAVRAFAAAAVLACAGCADRHDMAPPPHAYLVDDDALGGLSGLVHSRDHDGLLWALNDYDVLPRLFRIGPRGESAGRVKVRGALSFNSESLAVWDRDGAAHDWILIGDIGDNRGVRSRVHVLAVAEPAPDAVTARVGWRLTFRYPDGARDAEAMAVDHWHDELLVISKRDRPARLYRVPLTAHDVPGVVDAALVGELPGEVTGQVTGMALSGDGHALAVLTYDSVYLWHRGAGDDWTTVLATAPERVALPALPKAEGLAFSPAAGGPLFVGSEKLPAILLPLTRD